MVNTKILGTYQQSEDTAFVGLGPQPNLAPGSPRANP